MPGGCERVPPPPPLPSPKLSASLEQGGPPSSRTWGLRPQTPVSALRPRPQTPDGLKISPSGV
ncbi:hypothetical protein FE633_39725 [Streptomyces montanus]|uniref:Uncharacterized protein n=1 Tax=Streptomyces montanus TaxID=2580423 RepID=A0A5R9FCE0_9ACTN|nr:hypothetical protein FE633_39725 [Streptomyces montanus]